MEQSEAFESAVEAIVSGDQAALRTLLQEHPGVVQARSAKPHRSTLLHYVSANGVEDVRQKTPGNIVEIARILLAAGSDVSAESEAYGGRSTALNLTATSVHPERAGVQLALLQLLIDHGAKLDAGGRSDVNTCLANGRGEAARFLAEKGAAVDFEGAAGVGRFDLVRSLFDSASEQQKLDGFAWASQFGHTGIVEFLVAKGIPADAKLRRGSTGLHWASHGAHSAIVKLLLDGGAPTDIRDESFHGTPLDWALHAWSHGAERDYYDTVRLLVRAGAKLEADEYLQRKLEGSPEMQAALRAD